MQEIETEARYEPTIRMGFNYQDGVCPRTPSSANNKGYILGTQVVLVKYVTAIASLWNVQPWRGIENVPNRSESVTTRTNRSLLSNDAWCTSMGNICLGIIQTA